MKKYLFLLLSGLFLQACSNQTNETTVSTPTPKTIESAPATTATWNGSSLSTETMQKIQTTKYEYKQCVYKEASKQGYKKIDSRVATDAVIKQCESALTKIREVFTNDGVPTVITDRFLKKTRVDMTRKILQSLMFAEAARKAGATSQPYKPVKVEKTDNYTIKSY